MNFFAESVLKPYILEKGYREICEIGASMGENTDKLLELDSVAVSIVDPCVDAHLQLKYEGNPRVRIFKGLSLEVLPTLSTSFDGILIDGDHNWYTVYNELLAINRGGLLKPGGTVFFHDVGWPYGRRDMYYEPERIPAEFRQPYASRGIVRGRSGLSADAGINARHFNALHEGGHRNGVLAAVEDFMKEAAEDYEFFRLTPQNGLGVMRLSDGNRDKVFSRYRRSARLVNLRQAVKDVLGIA